MICSYLLHDRLFDTSKEALGFYGEARTQNAKVTVVNHNLVFIIQHEFIVKPETVMGENLSQIGKMCGFTRENCVSCPSPQTYNYENWWQYRNEIRSKSFWLYGVCGDLVSVL